MPSFRLPGTLTVIVGLLITPAFAHHSFSMFDDAKPRVLTGTVKDFEWTNPHTWLRLIVAGANGKTLEWALEMASVSTNTKNGWKADSIRPGDRVSVDIYPLKDGTRGGQVRAVTLPDGQRLAVGGGNYPRGQ